MPFLEYICPQCGYITEELVKSADDQPECPTCKNKMVRRYDGKMYSSTGKKGGGCSGDCKHCSGCH